MDPKKPLRLKKRSEFLKVSRQGTRAVGEFLCIDQRKAPIFRFGITASGRFGNSPERNRFKRLVREAIRTAFPLLPPHVEINISPRQRAKKAKMSDIQKEIIRLLS